MAFKVADLTRVQVELPRHWATRGESLWAVALGGDRYELKNVPFYAYNLNFGDTVWAPVPSPESTPHVRAVVGRSGHRTLRVMFPAERPEAEVIQLLSSLKPLSVSFERASSHYYALDLTPEADITRVRAQLDEWEAQGLLDYETCEERLAGSFDDAPDAD